MKMKKLLVTLLALIFILGTVATGMAAAPLKDVEGTDYEDAVTRLTAFGIISGYPDGTYRPDEPVTREQFAKIVVEMLGLGSAAEAAKGATPFSDVEPTRWSAGYINIAVGQGIIKGYPDGTFKPTEKVSYAEAITMLVRALGYKDSFLPGTWPGNYVSKAAELDITDGVAFATSGKADRGSVAIMVDNTLDCEVVKQDTFGDENNYSVQKGLTLLEDKLGITVYEDAEVTGVPRVNAALDEDQIQITYDSQTKKLTIPEEFNADKVFGLKGDAYVDGSDLVYFDVDNDYDFFYDQVDLDGSDTIDSDNKADFIIQDAEYEFEPNATVYINNDSLSDQDGDNDVDLDDLENVLTSKHVFGKYVLNDKGKIAFADLFAFEGKYDGLIVTKVDGEKIEYYKDSDDTKELDLEDDADAYVIYNSKGEVVDIDDIEADNVIYIADTKNKSTGDTDYFVIFVADDVVKGTLEAYEATDNIVVDGDTYDVTAAAIKTISKDDNDSISSINTTDLEDLLDEEVKVILDLVGDVRHIIGSVDTTSDDMYGILLGYETSFGDESVKIFTANGEKVIYDLDLDSGVTLDPNISNSSKAKKLVVKYTLDKDGEINNISVVADLTTTLINSGIGDADGEYGKNSIVIGSTEYFVTGSTIFMDLQDYVSSWDTDDVKFFEFDDIADKAVAASTELAFDSNSKDELKIVVFKAGASTTTDDTYYGYVTDVKKTSDGYKAVVDVYGIGVESYIVEDTPSNETAVNSAEKDVMKFKLNSKNELTLTTQAADTVTGYVYEIDGDYIKLATYNDNNNNGIYDTGDTFNSFVNGGTWFKVTDDTVYYDGTTKKDFYDLDEGTTNGEGTEIKALIDGRIIKAVKIK